MWQAILCVSAGAVLGALGRWGLSQWLNPIFSAFNFGTLFVNFVGCFLIGLLMAFFWQFPQFKGLWKLFLNTGFLGAFTTFSSFSSETIELFMSEKWLNGLVVILLHVTGGLFSTALGLVLYGLLVKS